MGQHNPSLDDVLAQLDPALAEDVYVFVTCDAVLTQCEPFAMVREDGRYSYVVNAADAERIGLDGEFRCRRLELGLDTELALVGLIARIGAELALHGIPVNPIAGTRRDHLFVPIGRANEALKVLEEVAARARLTISRNARGDPAARLQPVNDAIWVVDGPTVRFFGMPYPTRMTLIRLADGSLFVHSPIALDESLGMAVAALGEPRYLIAPNRLHHLFVADWVRRFPAARVYAAAGLEAKLDGLATEPLEVHEPPWHAEIDQLTFRGSPLMQEVVFLHRASRTLVVADLIENFDPATLTVPQRWLARLTGILAPRGSMPRDWRLSFVGGGRRIARDCALKILAWQPEAVLMAHGRLVTAGARPFLEQALRPFVPA